MPELKKAERAAVSKQQNGPALTHLQTTHDSLTKRIGQLQQVAFPEENAGTGVYRAELSEEMKKQALRAPSNSPDCTSSSWRG